jgi:uncharacterized RDD family membrane protein YckC
MKCPKCGYLGFEDVDRCRNCGYEFALSSPPVPVPELPIRTAQAMNPLDDLSLVDAATAPPPSVRMSDVAPEVDRVFAASSQSQSSPRSARAASATATPELPLFGAPVADDQPLITRASAPRAPLAVRRATPSRVQGGQPRAQSVELDADADGHRGRRSRNTPSAHDAETDGDAQSAPVVSRFVAVAIDLIILAAIDVVVVYFTMQICGVSWNEAALLPKGPMLAFLLVQNGGYLVAFTAGGQTLGKMATGIRVVPAESVAGLDLGRATMRTVVWLLLAVPAGLGFLTLLGGDHRGLHDRFAGTRVVRTSA